MNSLLNTHFYNLYREKCFGVKFNLHTDLNTCCRKIFAIYHEINTVIIGWKCLQHEVAYTANLGLKLTRGASGFCVQYKMFGKIFKWEISFDFHISDVKEDSGFKSIYLQQPIHFATVLINKTYSTITRQIEITNNH